jgi:hypothetical protein
MANEFVEAQRKIRAALIANRLKLAPDRFALALITNFRGELDWSDLPALSISEDAWARIGTLNVEPKFVFCHPDVVRWDPRTSLHYRGLSTLPLKAAKSYAGAVDVLERMDTRRDITNERALKIAKTYNRFISSVIESTDEWDTTDGERQVIASLGITLDGVMRNQIGQIAEKYVREMLLERLVEQGLVIDPPMKPEEVADTAHRRFKLVDEIEMIFSSEPDIAFNRDDVLICTVEIKGGTDPAGALERYGAAKKSLEAALKQNPHCENFFLSAVFTPEMASRIDEDRLIKKSYSIVELIDDKEKRDSFFIELVTYTLRLKAP